MRSALLCVFFALIIQRDGSNAADEDFRPVPIPVSGWDYDKRDDRAGTLQETIDNEEELASAAVPAHYWEDALRHSVYLTLVRDKIDQLIAKGEVISPETKPEHNIPTEVDDHDLWDKIKGAPFDRINAEEPASMGDVTIMAKGRLLEENGGYRFREDERTKEKCKVEQCMEGVKAIWSVKRVRQRDAETSPGRYHYELTFSVITQAPKKQRKPYENPVRTFTVKESFPERITDTPQEHRSHELVQNVTPRAERAIWVHKNIVTSNRARQSNGLDRFFSSLFDDDEPIVIRYVTPPPQYSKVGPVGASTDQKNKLMPYPYKPHTYKYTRPFGPPTIPMTSQGQPQPQHHYLDIEQIGVVSNPYLPQTSDNRPSEFRPYVVPNIPNPSPPKIIRPQRPITFQSPLTPISPTKNYTSEGSTETKLNETESTTKLSDIITGYNIYGKPKPVQPYFTEHIRPPIYNAPPGVFSSLDKKPFKPMPPLRLTKGKPSKQKPLDFRPSPQVLDFHSYSEPEPQDSFRPITTDYLEATDTSSTTTKESLVSETTQSSKSRRPVPSNKKPPKKHENIKSLQKTTSIPDIITVANSDSQEGSDTVEWASVLGAFTKTTPMASQAEETDKTNGIKDTTTTTTTTSTKAPSTTIKRRTTTTTEPTTTTSVKPKKRTRPPPKFKPEKVVKKHKRITTTKAPEAGNKKPSNDLTPQASSAATTSKPWWEVKPISSSTTATSTSTAKSSTTTTSTTTTTTTEAPATSTDVEIETNQPKMNNRFRQSTLMYKGTSVKHDKWSATPPSNDFKVKTIIPPTGKFPKRKASNFQENVPSTSPPKVDKERHKNHKDHIPFESKAHRSGSSNVMQLTTEHSTGTTKSTSPIYEEVADQYESESQSEYSPYQHENTDDDSDEEVEIEVEEQDPADHTEYVFGASTTSEATNELGEGEEQASSVLEPVTVTSPISVSKNKTKCKKKKHQNLTTADYDEITTTSTTTTTEATTPDIFEELFGGFTFDEFVDKGGKSTSKPEQEKQHSETNERYVKIDDDFEDLLEEIDEEKERHPDGQEYEEEDEDEHSSEDERSNEEYEESAESRDDSEHESKRPISLLELMAME